MDINELLKDVKSFNKEAAMKENMRMLALKDSIVADAFNEANVKLASYFGGIKLDSPESNLTEFSRNKLSGKMKAILSVSTTAGLKRLPIHFVVKASVPYMVETPEQVVAALEKVEGSLDKEVREILEKQKGLTDYHNEDIEVKADGLPGDKYKQVWFKKDGKSTWEPWGPIRDLNDFNRDFNDWVNDYFESEPDMRYCENWDEALEVLNTKGASARAGWFTLEDDGVDPNTTTASANSSITVQAKKKEINLVNRENTAASQFPVKLLVYPKTYLPELKKGDVVNVGGFKYKYIGDEPLLNGDTENGINARFELMRTDKKASLNKKAGESYGWYVDPSEAQEKLDLFKKYYGVSEALNSLTGALGNDLLNENLDYIFRMYDFSEGMSTRLDADTKLQMFIDAFGEDKALDELSMAVGNDLLSDCLAYIFRMNDFRKGDSNFGKESISKTHLNKKAEAEEDTEKCAICGEYFPVSDMINEVDFGHVCDNCFRGLKSRGEDLYKKAADDKKEDKSKKSEEDEDKEQRDKDFKDKLKFMQEEKHFEDLDPSQLMAMVTTYRYYHMRLPKEALDAISQSADSASRYMSSFDSLEEAFEEATPKIIERVVSSPKYLVGVLKNYSDDINFDTLPKQVKDKLMGDVVALVEVVKAAPSLLTEEVAEKIIKESPTEAETIYSTFGTVEEKGKGWDKIKEWAEEKKLDQAPTNEEIGIAQDDQPYKPNVKNDKSVDDDYTAMGTEEDSEPYNPSNKEEILGPNKNDLQVEDEEDKKASVDTTIKKEADATEFSTSLENVDLDISNIFIVRQLKESGIEVGFEYNEDVTKKLYAINKVSSNEFLKWNFDFSGSEQGIEYFRVVVPNQTIKVNVEYYTPEEYSNENGGDTTTSEIQIPLSNVKVDMHSMNTLEGMTLYPLSIEVDDNGGVEVSF